MNFISTIHGGFDTNMPMSLCIPLKDDGVSDRPSSWRFFGGVITKKNDLLSENMMTTKNDYLLQKYDDYCFNNDDILREGFEEMLKEIGYGSTEGVSDGYEEYCREYYMEVCEKKDEPLFPKVA